MDHLASISSAFDCLKLSIKDGNVYRGYILLAANHPLPVRAAVTEISVMQLAAKGLPKRKRRKYRNHEKRLTTIKENMRQVITPSVNYSRPIATTNCVYELSIIHKNHIQMLDEMGRANFVRQNGYKSVYSIWKLYKCERLHCLLCFYTGMIFSRHCLEPVVSKIVIVDSLKLKLIATSWLFTSSVCPSWIFIVNIFLITILDRFRMAVDQLIAKTRVEYPFTK